MNQPSFPYHVFPLGDSAITVDYGNCIDENINTEVINRSNFLHQHPLPGMIDVASAYSSFTVYYNVFALQQKITANSTVFDWMKKQLEHFLSTPIAEEKETGRLIKIPVCYAKEMGPDLLSLADAKKISVEELIYLHTTNIYKVYMLGFLPGFAYMGKVDERIVMPRKKIPVTVQPGSVGIAGRQTGIYPQQAPGGWQIIGATPITLFNKEKTTPVLLKAGDRVQFVPISEKDFTELRNNNDAWG